MKKPCLKSLKKILLTAAMLFFVQFAGSAQTTKEGSKNNTYLDAAVGIFSMGSINYERKIVSWEKIAFYGRIGGGFGININASTGWGGLGAISMLTGSNNSHFELNGGAFIGREAASNFVLPIINLGYRYQKPDGGFLFRSYIGVAAVGLSFGFSF